LCRSVMVVETSFRWGTLPTLTGSDASRVPHRIGSAEFLAPEMAMAPSSRAPPVMSSLSNERSAPRSPGARLFGRQGPDGEGVDLVAHAIAQRPVHEPVPGSRPQPGECPGNDDGLEVRAVGARYPHLRVRDARADQAGNGFGVHRPSVSES